MRVVITGAAGFIGRALTKALFEAGKLADPTDTLQAISELVLVDRAFPDRRQQLQSNPGINICTKTGDLADPVFIEQLMSEGDVQCIFHLAASLTLDAENHDEQAYLVNVEAIRRFIKKASGSTRFIYASSIAVFGGDIPDTVTDALRAAPETTYGTHKAIAELMLADASRKALIDARSIRLPIVLVRPGANSPTISDRIAAIVREPLAGRDVVCAIDQKTLLPIASARTVANALIRLQNTPACKLPDTRVMNLPSLTVSVAQMQASVRSQTLNHPVGKINYEPDSGLQRIIDGWPKGLVSAAATDLGIGSDTSFDDIISDYLADTN